MGLLLNKKIALYSLLVLFIVSSPALLCAEESDKETKSVLILSSPGYSQHWSTSIAKGIKNLYHKVDPNAIVKIDYLGAEHQNSLIATRFTMQRIFTMTYGKIEDVIRTPHLVIIIGDDAWMTYRIMTLRGWVDTPVILCNVNEEILDDYSLFFRNRSIDPLHFIQTKASSDTIKFTGIVKPNSTPKTISLINELFPQKTNLLFYSDNSYADNIVELNIKKYLDQNNTDYSLNVIYDEKVIEDSIYNDLKLLGENDVILLNNLYSAFKTLRTESPKIQKITSRKEFPPIFVFNDVNPTDSITIGGVFTPIDALIQHTVDFSTRILNGEDPANIPLQHIYDRVVLNQSALRYMNVSRRARDINDLVYQNIPDPFIVRYQKPLFFTLLILLFSIILFVFRKRAYTYRIETERALDKFKTLYDEFSIVFENMPIGLILFDRNGNLITYNPEIDYFQKFLFPESSIDNSNLFELKFITDDIKTQLRKRHELDLIIPVQSADDDSENNDSLYFRLIIRHIESSKPEVSNVLVSIIDVSHIHRERIEKEKMDYLFEFAMEKSHLGVAEYNIVTRKGYATESWYRNLRINPVSGFENPYKFIHPEDIKYINAFLTDLAQGQGKNSSFTGTVRTIFNNDIHWLRYIIRVTEFSPKEGRIILAELSWNIDEQKQREIELETALKKAKESEMLKNGFIANMSQEINTPLNAIIHYSDALIDTQDVETKMEMLAKLEANNNTLLKLIGEIIDLSKIESDSVDFKFSETDINVLVNEIVFKTQREVDRDRIKVLHEQKGDKHLILMDKQRLSQVLECFADNAVKHTHDGEIKIGYAITGTQLYLYISDTGEGIDEKTQRELHDSITNHKKFYKNFGLGLQISRSIVTKMGGVIGFNSQLGSGSTFWCRIPVRFVEHTRAGRHRSNPGKDIAPPEIDI